MVKIGIDPDVSKSGVAVYDGEIKSLHNLSFFDLFEFLREKTHCKVFIEASWLIKTNWHTNDFNAQYNAQIGSRTGANHEAGRKIVEMCEYLGIQYEQIKPSRSKVNAEYFKSVSGFQGRTNQEQRDAAMLVIGR